MNQIMYFIMSKIEDLQLMIKYIKIKESIKKTLYTFLFKSLQEIGYENMFTLY